VGKLSGATGNYNHVSPEVEALTMKTLGLKPNPLSTQVIGRDRHADVFNSLALVGCAIERLALRIRLLSQSEIKEVSESHGSGYKGSSAMPHKSNPVSLENLCGLARLLRGYAQVGMENTGLWLERDISHSSAERFIIPDATGITHYMIKRMTSVIANLAVHTERMKEGVYQNEDWTSQTRMLELIKNGMSRAEAHAMAASKIQAGNEDTLIMFSGISKPGVDAIFKKVYEDIYETSRRFDLGMVEGTRGSGTNQI